MNTFTYFLSLAMVGLVALISLLTVTVILAKGGQTIWAALTGTGAVAVGVIGLYQLLMLLGKAV